MEKTVFVANFISKERRNSRRTGASERADRNERKQQRDGDVEGAERRDQDAVERGEPAR